MADARAEDRGIAACSDAERRRADALAQLLRESGREVRVVPLWVRPAWWLVLALCAAAGVLASALAVDREALGLSIAGGALLVALVDLTTGELTRRLGPARATQAVVATPPTRGGERDVTVVLSATIDDARHGLARRLPVRLVPATLATLALLTTLLGVRAVGADGLVLDLLQLLPTLALLGAIALLLDACRATPASGEDAAGAAIAAAAALDAKPPAHVDVAVVLAGAGDPLAAGLSAWLRGRRRRGLDPVNVAIVHLEAGAPASTWRERDGVVLRLRPHRQLLAAARSAGETQPRTAARAPVRASARDGAAAGDEPSGTPVAADRSDVTPAGVVGPRGWPAIAIGADAAFAERLVRELSATLGEPAR